MEARLGRITSLLAGIGILAMGAASAELLPGPEALTDEARAQMSADGAPTATPRSDTSPSGAETGTGAPRSQDAGPQTDTAPAAPSRPAVPPREEPPSPG